MGSFDDFEAVELIWSFPADERTNKSVPRGAHEPENPGLYKKVRLRLIA